MDFSSPHLGFVMASYGLFATVLLALLILAIWRGRNLQRELQARGLKDIGHAAVEPDKKP
jgi:heme exporter protein CcmD